MSTVFKIRSVLFVQPRDFWHFLCQRKCQHSLRNCHRLIPTEYKTILSKQYSQRNPRVPFLDPKIASHDIKLTLLQIKMRLLQLKIPFLRLHRSFLHLNCPFLRLHVPFLQKNSHFLQCRPHFFTFTSHFLTKALISSRQNGVTSSVVERCTKLSTVLVSARTDSFVESPRAQLLRLMLERSLRRLVRHFSSFLSPAVFERDWRKPHEPLAQKNLLYRIRLRRELSRRFFVPPGLQRDSE